MSKQFRPWLAEFYYSIVLGGISLVILAQAFRAGWSKTGLVAVVLAAFLATGSRLAWMDGRRRWFGAELEKWAIGRATPLLKKRGLGVEANYFIPGLGDADMLVTNPKTGKSAIIEIKSYGYEDSRCSKALQQVTTLQRALGTDVGLVWLPRAKTSWRDLFKMQPMVMKGSPEKIVKVVARMLK